MKTLRTLFLALAGIAILAAVIMQWRTVRGIEALHRDYLTQTQALGRAEIGILRTNAGQDEKTALIAGLEAQLAALRLELQTRQDTAVPAQPDAPSSEKP